MAVSRDGRLVFTASSPDTFNYFTSPHILTRHDVENNTSRVITTHGNMVGVPVLSRGQTLIATTATLGNAVRVGSTNGDEPHLLSGSAFMIAAAFSPDEKWITCADNMEPVVLLWRMPEGRPFHTLPRDEFLDRLRALTCRQVVPDAASATGYRANTVPSPGWGNVPTW